MTGVCLRYSGECCIVTTEMCLPALPRILDEAPGWRWGPRCVSRCLRCPCGEQQWTIWSELSYVPVTQEILRVTHVDCGAAAVGCYDRYVFQMERVSHRLRNPLDFEAPGFHPGASPFSGVR